MNRESENTSLPTIDGSSFFPLFDNGLYYIRSISSNPSGEIELLLSKMIKMAAEHPTLNNIKSKKLPSIAWPTILLFFGCWLLFLLGFWLAVASPFAQVPGVRPLGFLMQLVGNFFLFTVAHEAAHNAISSHHTINETIGRLAALLFFPCTFGAWK